MGKQAHQIDGLNGSLVLSIGREKQLREEMKERAHMLEVVNDHTIQLNQRISLLEKELSETKEAAEIMEKNLLKDLHETRKNLDQMTKENHGLKVVLEAKEQKLTVVTSSATQERETIMRRMVEYDHQNRSLISDLEKRDLEVTSLSGSLAKESAANHALKGQLAELQEQIDSMGTSNALALSDVRDVTGERNDLLRQSKDATLQYKSGRPFKLYAWDILSSHPNPRAELEIVYSIFSHFHITMSQVYIHYATSSTTVYFSGKNQMGMLRSGRKGGGRSDRGRNSGRSSGSGRLRLLMTRSDFRTFAMESKIWDHPLFSTAFIDLAFEKSILGGTRKGGREVVMEADKLNGGHTTKSERYFVPTGTMTKRDFKEALLRLSHARFPHLKNVGEKLVVLFEKHIIPYCESALIPEEEEEEEDDVVRLGRKYENMMY